MNRETSQTNKNDLIKVGLQDSLKIENTSLTKLNKLLSETRNEKMRKSLEHHVEETNEQISRVTKRMQALSIPTTAESAEAADILVPRTETPSGMQGVGPLRTSDNVKNGYAWENYEIAHYEFLKEESDRLGDDETKSVAEHNLKEEKEFADEIKDMIPDLVKKEIV